MKSIRLHLAWASLVLVSCSGSLFAEEAAEPDFARDVAPLLRKYCAGCHNDEDREGGLALDSYGGLLQGGEHGAVITPRRGDLSRLIRVLTGEAKPSMPPEGEARPNADEAALLQRWIDAGAKGPDGGELDPTILITPKIKPAAHARPAINDLALSHDGTLVAAALYGEVHVKRRDDDRLVRKLEGCRGNVNAVSFSRDDRFLLASAGEAGVFGEVRLWNVADGKLAKLFQGHRDSVYSAALSPDGKLLASASYDKSVKLWSVESGEPLRTLFGHNAAVFHVAFHPSGQVLASASGDRTVKLWDVATGNRLDTLGQSLQELYALAFSPNGKRLAAGGVDNRIRVWGISPSAQEGTNPLLHSIFAHDAPILRLSFSGDGRRLVSSGEDSMVKVWNAHRMTLRSTIGPQPDWATGLATTEDGRQLIAGRRDGIVDQFDLAKVVVQSDDDVEPLDERNSLAALVQSAAQDGPAKVTEAEPNDDAETATPLDVPATASGRVFADGADKTSDVDVFRFAAKKGDVWIVEIDAARSGSPLDSKVEVLHEDGSPVQRCVLRAVRDSEITFRGINSDQLNCRVTNWEEMELNEYLYIGGELVKLYLAPRGPDSGFNFYPNTGQRYCYFDTSARSHPLGQPCYIVVPYPVGTKLPDNGLPVFPVYYENDDDALRRAGTDSLLTFTAPADGVYLARVSDVRGFQGNKFSYQLVIRRPQPDFKVTVSPTNPTVNAASGKTFTARAERIDGFEGPIRVEIAGLPPGFSASSPLVIEAGQLEAQGVINAAPDAPPPTEENWAQSKVTATADIAGEQQIRDAGSFGTIKLAAKPKVTVYLEPMHGETKTEPAADQSDVGLDAAESASLVIQPGSSITCKLRVERHEFADRIQLDVNNLPHGVIVDDIGLNGVLIPEGESERTIFIKAASWVPETRRAFHAVAKVDGEQASLPIFLRVQKSEDAAAAAER